jgi:hypothetical protein
MKKVQSDIEDEMAIEAVMGRWREVEVESRSKPDKSKRNKIKAQNVRVKDGLRSFLYN